MTSESSKGTLFTEFTLRDRLIGSIEEPSLLSGLGRRGSRMSQDETTELGKSESWVQSPVYWKMGSEVQRFRCSKTYARRTVTQFLGNRVCNYSTICIVLQSPWRVLVIHTQRHVLSEGMFCESNEPSLRTDPSGWQAGSSVVGFWVRWAERVSDGQDVLTASPRQTRRTTLSAAANLDETWEPVLAVALY